MTAKHTPGPWFSDGKSIWRRRSSELYENGGGVAGDIPIATAHKGWTGNGEIGYPVEENARLISAAPELLEFVEEVRRTGDTRLASMAIAVIAKATGG